jgi:hypothetical protein
MIVKVAMITAYTTTTKSSMVYSYFDPGFSFLMAVKTEAM